MSIEQENTKEYLGDGVYVDFNGFQLILTTEDGISATNTIYLEDADDSELSPLSEDVHESDLKTIKLEAE